VRTRPFTAGTTTFTFILSRLSALNWLHHIMFRLLDSRISGYCPRHLAWYKPRQHIFSLHRRRCFQQAIEIQQNLERVAGWHTQCKLRRLDIISLKNDIEHECWDILLAINLELAWRASTILIRFRRRRSSIFEAGLISDCFKLFIIINYLTQSFVRLGDFFFSSHLSILDHLHSAKITKRPCSLPLQFNQLFLSLNNHDIQLIAELIARIFLWRGR